MKLLRSVLSLLLLPFVLVSLLQCSSVKKLQNNVPFKIGKVYYQDWVSGVQGGGSGTNLFIQILSNPSNVVLDSACFMEKIVKLEFKNDSTFIGRFKKETNQKRDIIMSNEPYAEYGNQVPKIRKKTFFDLNTDECIISYNIKNKIGYFKIDNVVKKESIQYR